MANELVLKIRTDSRGNPVGLDNMPIEAVDVLTVFLEALSDLAKQQQNPAGITVSLRSGSIESVLEYPEADTEIDTGISDVVEGRSPNNDFYKALRSVQDKIKANGLTYEVIHKVKDVPRSLTEEFKAKNFVRRTGARKEKTEEVVFFKGVLFESGGKKTTNIHLDVNGADVKVECTQDQAKRLNALLYLEIRVCALKKTLTGGVPTYELLDSYATEATYSLFKIFYESINTDASERFDVLYERVIEAVEAPRVKGEIVKLLRLFDYPQADRGNLRTILVALKPVRNGELIIGPYERLANHLRAGSTHNVI